MNNLRVFIPLFVLRLFHRIASNVNFVEFLWPSSFLLSSNCNTTIQYEYATSYNHKIRINYPLFDFCRILSSISVE